LFEYSNNSIVNWRPEAAFVRPKWGIYRSLINAQDLRDEAVLFANFSIEELELSTSLHTAIEKEKPIIFSNPVTNIIYITELSKKVNLIKIFSLDGRKIMDKLIDSNTAVHLDVSLLPKGTYILNFIGKQVNQSELILIN